tara:strand:+ start:1497 stop:1817 length:321 start_codon:yes stop_codon:yes gene_type:complete
MKFNADGTRLPDCCGFFSSTRRCLGCGELIPHFRPGTESQIWQDEQARRRERKLLTAKELSRHFQVGASTIREWCATGAIPCIKLPHDGGVRYDLDAVLAALDGGA